MVAVVAVSGPVAVVPAVVRLPAVTLPETETVVPKMSVVVRLPVADMIPSLRILPPVMLPVADTPGTPNTTIDWLTLTLLAITLPAVIRLAPATLAEEVTLPVAVISPAVMRFPPVRGVSDYGR